MKVTATPIEQSQIVLDIEVDQDRLDKALDQAYRRAVTRVKVPGFRPGKAPRQLVERMIGSEALLDDAVQQLVPKVFEDALEEQQLTPAARPRLEVVNITPLQVKATVPVQPTITLGNYRDVRIPLDEVNITDEQIDDVILRLRQSNAEWAPVERPIEAGDLIGLDALVKDGDNAVIEATDAEFIVDPEGINPVPEFSDHLLGKQVGDEIAYTITIPEDFETERLQGKTVDVTATVHWIKAKELPELDDAFASTVGEYDSIQALRDAVKEDLEGREKQAAASKHLDEVLSTVSDQATLEIPPQMVDERADEMFHELERSLGAQGIAIDKYLEVMNQSEDEFKESFKERAERSVRRSLVVQEVAKAETIEIPDEDIRAELQAAVGDDKNGPRLVEQALAREATRERIAAMLRERKATAMLVDLALGGDGKPKKIDESEAAVEEIPAAAVGESES
ncbi:MAG TPA: trigger factor [Chloroflexota bacterium]|nr:trigger factor [Chloroflexota bacterium]